MPPNLDYSNTTQEVFIAAAQYMITERQDFCIWWAEYPPMHRTFTGMPSWVPDFHHSPETTSPAHLGMQAVNYEKWTNHMHDIGQAKCITVSPTEGIQAQAHILDRIKWVSPIMDPNANKAAHTNPFWIADSAMQKSMEAFGSTKPAWEIPRDIFTTLILHQVSRAFEVEHDPLTQGLAESFTSFIAEAAVYRNFEQMTNAMLSDAISGTTRDWSQLHQHPGLQSQMSRVGEGDEYLQKMRTRAAGRRFFLTEKGYMGMSAVELVSDSWNSDDGTPEGIMVGDAVALLVGGFFPYVFREVDPHKFMFRGEAYVCGIMELEYFKTPTGNWRGDIGLTDVRIV